MNWCYETTLVRFVFTWTLCWSKNVIVQVSTKARSSCILTKFAWESHKIRPPSEIMQFSNCHQVQILDWKPGFCKSADFIGQNEKKSKNQHQKLNIPSSSVSWFGDSKVTIILSSPKVSKSSDVLFFNELDRNKVVLVLKHDEYSAGSEISTTFDQNFLANTNWVVFIHRL